MLRLKLFCVVIGLLAPHVASKHVQFYRKDYTYIEEYDAFYKMHWDANGNSWSNAFNACYEEGAKLFYPSGDEWTIVKNLTDAMPEAPNTTVIYVGLHDEFNLGEFITIDGKATENPLDAEDELAGTSFPDRCLFMDYVTGQFRISPCTEAGEHPIKPFICKKVDDESCPTIDNEYKYVKDLKKCYKVNNIKKTWQAAMRTCFMEGGLLAIIGSRTDVPDWTDTEQSYFVGFRKMFSSPNFYTVKGNKFESIYFNGEYYSSNYPDAECGVMVNNNNNDLLRVKNCNEQLSFICEMSV